MQYHSLGVRLQTRHTRTCTHARKKINFILIHPPQYPFAAPQPHIGASQLKKILYLRKKMMREYARAFERKLEDSVATSRLFLQ